MGSSSRSMSISCLLCIGLLVFVASETKAAAAASTQGMSTTARMPNAEVKLNPLYAIKRRVPNGPDPIHNRRAGKSGRPPGRA